MSFLERTFSYDAPYVKIFSLSHLCFFIFAIFTILFFLKKKDFIKKNRETIRKIFIGLLIFQPILLYSWFFFCTEVFLSDGLPLHLCRIAGFIALYYLVSKKEWAINILGNFSLFATLTFFYPSAVYHFAHITTPSYMINHLSIVLIPIFAAVAYDWYPSMKAFKQSAIAYLIYIGFIIIINPLTGGNYFYLNKRPFAFLNEIPLSIYLAVVIVITLLLFFVFTKYLLHLKERKNAPNR